MSATDERCTFATWKLDGSIARLHAASISAQLDIQRPSRGLSALQIQGQPMAGMVLGIGIEPQTASAVDSGAAWLPADIYVRGCDLVATYREPLGEPFNLQVYWRALEPQDNQSAAIEAIVSIQTPLWEAYPCVTSSTAVHGDDATVQDEALAVQLGSGGWYVETTCPGDFTLSHARSADGFMALSWRFGRQFMERGVIRRLRLRGAFAREMNAALMQQARKALAAEPPPLTV